MTVFMEEMDFYSHIQSDQPDVSGKKSMLGFTPPSHKIEYDDIGHTVRLNDGPKIHFITSEYQLFTLLWEQRCTYYVSYVDIAQYVYEYDLDDKLLHTIRRRISDIRNKVVSYGIDIINIPYRGYKVGC
jgi:hypothetical protein